MPKKSNAEKVWSNKLPKILKPVGCSFSDDEWNDFSSFFPVNGWDAYPPEPDKTGEIIKKLLENKANKYKNIVSQNKCLLCGEVTDGLSSHYRKDLGLCVACCQSVFYVRRCKRNRLVIDPENGKEIKKWDRVDILPTAKAGGFLHQPPLHSNRGCCVLHDVRQALLPVCPTVRYVFIKRTFAQALYAKY